MFETLKKPGSFIVKSATLIGGAYVIRRYMQERLVEEVRLKMEEERKAREKWVFYKGFFCNLMQASFK